MNRLLSRIRGSNADRGTPWYAWSLALAGTAAMLLLVWRLSVLLGSPLVLLSAFAVPAALSLKSLLKAFVSFSCVTVAGILLMHDATPGAKLGFLFTGGLFAAAAVYITVVAGDKLNEARRALGMTRLRAAASQAAVQRAGVCVIVLNRSLSWVSANDAAWNAVGSDARFRRGMDARVELDNEAAISLMHSASRESWRSFQEAVIADAMREQLRQGQALPPYRIALYDIAGQKTVYRFTVTMGQGDQLLFIGYPEAAPKEEQTKSPEAWFADVVNSMSEAALAVQADGAILAANRAFNALCGAGGRARYVFDCPNLHGVSERTFVSGVWLPTMLGPVDLPDVCLEGSGPAVGARVSPPTAAYTEAVLVVFREEGGAVPQGFVEHTRPAPL